MSKSKANVHIYTQCRNCGESLTFNSKRPGLPFQTKHKSNRDWGLVFKVSFKLYRKLLLLSLPQLTHEALGAFKG